MQSEAKAVAHTVNKHIRIDEELCKRYGWGTLTFRENQV